LNDLTDARSGVGGGQRCFIQLDAAAICTGSGRVTVATGSAFVGRHAICERPTRRRKLIWPSDADKM